jgi:hypothetical protein
MVHQGRKTGARSPKAIRVSKRISKRAKNNLNKENAVAKCLDFAAPAAECAEPEAEPVDQPPTDEETTQEHDETMAEDQEEASAEKAVLPPIDADDADLESTEDREEKEEEPRELTEEEKIAASKQDLIDFFEESSFALAMQARLLSQKPDHELNYGCLLTTLSTGSSLPRSVLEHITLVWKKDNKWIRAWLANELCDPSESEAKEEIPDAEAELIDFYTNLCADTKDAATALTEKPDAEFNFGLMCTTLASGPLPAEVSKALAMKWKTDQSWVREWLAGKLSTA